MISFGPTKDETAFVKVARDLAENKIRPQARKMEESRVIEQSLLDELKSLGFLSLELPEYYGGLELPLITQVQIVQGLSYGDLGVVQGIPDCGDGAPLYRLAKNNPVLALFKDSIKDLKVTSLIDIEEEAWGNQFTIQKTSAGYELNGTTPPARLAQVADILIVTGKDQEGNKVILILDESIQWEVLEGDYRLGLLNAGIGKVNFNQEIVPNDYVLAVGEEAERMTSKVRVRNRILHSAKQVGLMEAALDYATEYTAGRKAFGQEIAKFQGVSFRIAKMAIETRIANHLLWEAAIKSDSEEDEAEGLALRAMYRAHRSLRFVTDSAVQLLGGHGYVQEFPVEKWMRDAQAQIALYDREQDLLSQWGKQIIGAEEERVIGQ